MRNLLEELKFSGGRSIPSRILHAPLEGIMSPEYCRAFMEFNLVRSWTTPFIRISNSLPRQSVLDRKIQQFRPLPIIVQLMGSDRSLLSKTASLLSGLEHVAGVELNCACPSPDVIRSGAGGAQLRNPDWIKDALTALRDACPDCGLGVKLRAGFSSHTEMDAILDKVVQCGTDWIVIHHRTVLEKYADVAGRNERLSKAREIVKESALFASGDLFSPADACSLAKSIGLDGLTPARGMMRNPWLIREIENLCAGRQDGSDDAHPLLLLIRIVQLAAEGGHKKPGSIVEFAKNLFPSSNLFRLMSASKSPKETIEIIENFERVPG